jgi:hypothetical protein
LGFDYQLTPLGLSPAKRPDGIIDAENSRTQRLFGSYYVNLGFKISCRGGPQMLGELLADISERIFVAGTHFASTSVTSAMSDLASSLASSSLLHLTSAADSFFARL